MSTAPISPTAPEVQPFLTIGAAAIVTGGICAAVTGPTEWEHGSWVAAFLVLVVGVGQIGLGVAQAALTTDVDARRRGRQALSLNSGAALVIAGTLASLPIVVTAGSVLVLAALVSFARAERGRVVARPWMASAYTALLVVLIVSTPIGIALSWLRA